MKNHRRVLRITEIVALMFLLVGYVSLPTLMFYLKFSGSWHTSQTQFVALLVLLAGVCFPIGISIRIWETSLIAKRNLPWIEDLPDDVYSVQEAFTQYGKMYYKVQGTNGKVWLIESSQTLPPHENKLLPPGYWRNRNSAVEVNQHRIRALHGSPT